MPPTPTAPGSKLKVLCLHGYMQNGDVLRLKMGSWRKGLKSRLDFEFVDAPIRVIETDNAELAERLATSSLDHRSWWNFTSSQRGQRPGTQHSVVISGWQEAEDTVRAALDQHGPVFALLGFSQGATAAALYASRCIEDATLPAPRCIIAVSGFMPRDEEIARALRARGIAMPTLHVIGAADEIIPRERSEELATCCSTARKIVHPGGHFLPTCSGTFKQEVAAFVDSAAAQAQVSEQSVAQPSVAKQSAL